MFATVNKTAMAVENPARPDAPVAVIFEQMLKDRSDRLPVTAAGKSH
jgi:hypothetical protein